MPPFSAAVAGLTDVRLVFFLLIVLVILVYHDDR
jgi:hypothetical protein